MEVPREDHAINFALKLNKQGNLRCADVSRTLWYNLNESCLGRAKCRYLTFDSKRARRDFLIVLHKLGYSIDYSKRSDVKGQVRTILRQTGQGLIRYSGNPAHFLTSLTSDGDSRRRRRRMRRLAAMEASQGQGPSR